ncbi:MAG: hypothetical protein M3157_05080 [Actinomycetota bacterium]|nr:hypothetical protein [Actinomycetota bacterium]
MGRLRSLLPPQKSSAKSAGVEVEDFIRFAKDPPEEAQLKLLARNDRELAGEGFIP